MRDELEDMLGELHPAEPSAALDQRIEALIAEAPPRPPGWPTQGLAAIALVGIAVLAGQLDWTAPPSSTKPKAPAQPRKTRPRTKAELPPPPRVERPQPPLIEARRFGPKGAMTPEQQFELGGAQSIAFEPIRSQREETLARPQGIVYSRRGGVPYYRVRIARKRLTQWIDKSRGIRISITVPAEEVLLVPVPID